MNPGYAERRPGQETAVAERVGAPSGYDTGTRIIGSVVINVSQSGAWSFADDDRVSSRLKNLTMEPSGSFVTIVVAKKQCPDYTACDYIRRHGQHLARIVVECDDSGTIARWVHALRLGTDAFA